jgi:hypothetical protein
MTAHWGVEDPAAAEGSETDKWMAFRKAFHELESRIKGIHEFADPDSRQSEPAGAPARHREGRRVRGNRVTHGA